MPYAYKIKEHEELEKMKEEYAALEAKMVAFALEHELQLYLGTYGYGRELLLEDEADYYKRRGDWLPSSQTC